MIWKCLATLSAITALFSATNASGADGSNALLADHPRLSYEDVTDIETMESALRKALVDQERYSFSRSWWKWDRLRARYVDGGRTDENALRILRAAFRGLILDWHARLEAKGEGDLFYIFFVTTAPGDKNRRQLDDHELVRDVHGGGYHGGWGGASRMRIYVELSRADMLTDEEEERFRQIVHQSLSPRFLDFTKGSQKADNHSFGNGGGVALALKHFPDAPGAVEARAWLDRVWGNLAEFGDWREWTYYPYGPIFLHGMLDIAEATGQIETESVLINTLGRRALGFMHGGGVRGNPNSGATTRKDLAPVYANPWDVGYYDVETSARDGHFWYRLAQHYENPEYLWAAEQVLLGGRPPEGDVPPEYEVTYKRRFAWFAERGIEPRLPASAASVGLLSPGKHRIAERLYLNAGRKPGKPFAAYFLYDQKDAHLDNVSGHLYEYSVDGAKLLHTSGKYNNVYSGNRLRGGGTGEESLDLFLVMQECHAFPLHPDREGNERDHMRRGFIKHLADQLRAENNEVGDSFGQFVFDNYYGENSRWTRRTVLTHEGYLVVSDEYRGGDVLGKDYVAGPVWHLGVDEKPDGPQQHNWFDAPAIDHAWWQTDEKRVLLYFHDDGVLEFGSRQQSHSQDVDPNRTTFAYRPIESERTERFLTVFVPHGATLAPEELLGQITTQMSEIGSWSARIGGVMVTIEQDGSWSVKRETVDGS